MAADLSQPVVRRIERYPGPTHWTEVEAFTPGAPLTMDLRPRADGDSPGLALGDPAFDGRYFLTAAPEQAARCLFDDRVRARLVEAAEVWIVHRERGFMLVQAGRLTGPALARLIELATALVDGIPRAFDAVERALPRSGAPYRPGVAPEALALVHAQRNGELRALVRARDRDVNRTMMRFMAKALRLPLGIALVLALAAHGRC